MIDTVCLLLPKSSLILLNERNPNAPRWDLQSATDSYTKHVRNPSAKEKQTGLYFPRITAYNRKFQKEPQVKIEFSVPKLIYNNNLDELTDDQFSSVIKALQDRLKRMGIRVFQATLEAAPVSTAHYARNFLLEDGQTATNVISQFGKIDVRKSFDFTRAKYTNDGQSLCCHTTAHELIFYDKIADLNKNKKRAVDKDQTEYQLTLFDRARIRGHPEVLRMEVRLAQKQKLNSVFAKLNLTQNPTFKQVFQSEVSKKVIRLYWKEVTQTKNLGALTIEVSPIETAKRVVQAFPRLGSKQILAAVGLTLVSQSGNGLRELRTLLSTSSHDRTWSRIMKEHEKVLSAIATGSIRSWVKSIERQIDHYTPIKTDQLF